MRPHWMFREAQLRSDLVVLAAEYHASHVLFSKAAADRKGLRDRLALKLALLKAKHVGKGRDGSWAPFLKDQLQLPVRTVDRWIHMKLVGGQLPAWAAQKLATNQRKTPPVPRVGAGAGNVQRTRATAQGGETERPKSFAEWSEFTEKFFSCLPKAERTQNAVEALRLIRELGELDQVEPQAMDPIQARNVATVVAGKEAVPPREAPKFVVHKDGTTELLRPRDRFGCSPNPILMAPIVEMSPEELAKH